MRALALLALLPLVACSAGTPPVQSFFAGSTMGTQYSVKLTHRGLDETALQASVEATLDDVNRMMSTYMPESEISVFNSITTTGWHEVSEAFCDSVDQALEISQLTGGAFDITVAPLVNLWGFGPGEMIEEPPSAREIDALLQSVGYEYLHADCDIPALKKDIANLMLDMSAFGKGLAVDYVAELLDQLDIDDYMVEVGGELRLKGRNPEGRDWAIGIEKPLDDRRQPYTVVHLTDAALATSGDYRNFFMHDGQRFSHTIDTRTGRPVTHNLASVTVVDDSGYRADALATALLVMGPDEGLELAKREKLAVLFLLRDESGIGERATPAFEKLRAIG